MDIKYLVNEEDWNLFYNSNKSKDIIIFKFSPICPLSFMIEKKFNSWANNINDDKKVVVYKIDVINSKPLSHAIEKQFNIRHESPQVIWLDNKGNVKWNADHFGITKGALDKQLTERVSF